MKNNYNKVNFDQNNNQKYCLVQFTELVEDAYEFSRDAWPEHITLAGVFRLKSMATMADLGLIASKTPSFNSRVIDHDSFGYNGERVRVALLEKCENLILLHENMVKALKSSGADFKQPAPLGDKYRPHISETRKLDLKAIGYMVSFDRLSLVDLTPGGDKSNRRIVWQRDLAGRKQN